MSIGWGERNWLVVFPYFTIVCGRELKPCIITGNGLCYYAEIDIAPIQQNGDSIMVRTIEVMEASDGTLYKYKNAAKRYEKGITLGNKINGLPISQAARTAVANNWEEIRKIAMKAGTVLPNEQIPDTDVLFEDRKIARLARKARKAKNA